MSTNEREGSLTYKVVVNEEEQYSIWPVERDIPNGWRGVGTSGSESVCLAFIKEVWSDMRPLSLRKKIEEAKKNKQKE